MSAAARPTIGLVVPARNEAVTIAEVARVALASGVGELIVVSDGSTDATAARAREAGARVLELERNVGKGGAVAAGARALQTDYVMLVDADLLGLRAQHLHDLAAPVLEGRADATVGVFTQGRGPTDLGQSLTPFLSGQRLIPRRLLLGIEGIDTLHYAIELAITRRVEALGLRVLHVKMPGLSQVMKEEKRGILRGFAHRLRMYWQIVAFAARPGGTRRPG